MDDKPAQNNEVLQLYDLLCSLVTGITPETGSMTLRDGSGERLNGYIDEIVTLTKDNKLNDYKVKINYSHNNTYAYVLGENYIRNLHGLVTYLFSSNKSLNYYGSPPPAPAVSNKGNAPTFNNHLLASQQNEQTTSVDIQFNQTIIQVAELLSGIERDYPDEDSKENKFSKALKKVLPTAKDTLGIISLILTVAGQLGITPEEVAKLLHLS